MLYFARWKSLLIVAVIAAGILFALPNALPENARQNVPDWLPIPTQTINLGLDLQGGAHLLLEVQAEEVIAERLEVLQDDVRLALREQRILVRGPRIADVAEAGGERQVEVTIRDPNDVGAAMTALRDLAQPLDGGLLGGTGAQDISVQNIGDNTIALRLTDQAQEQIKSRAVQQSIEIVRRRIDELGTREPAIFRQGADRIVVQVPGESDPQRIIELLGQTAKMEFKMHDPSVSIEQALDGRVPPGSRVYESESPTEPFILLRERTLVGGERLTNAGAGFDAQTQQPIVTFRFDSAGARRFADVTSRNVGQRFAIVLDDRVITAPVIRAPITTGSGQIEGNFTVETANDLAILLRAGALPAPLVPLEQRTVGPDLGADSIQAGRNAAIIGLVAVLAFMVLSYGRFGIFANISLVANLVLIAGALSLLQATLTLPGIAGIVLTVGMAVDANVLIYERIREEVRAGKTPISAIETGYRRALSAILDANITTFIAAAILFMMGSGPIRGFAVTLGIGIVTSVFTAFVFNRMMVATWLRGRRPESLAI